MGIAIRCVLAVCASMLLSSPLAGQEIDEADMIRYARISIVQRSNNDRHFDNLLFRTIVGQNSVLSGDFQSRYRKFVLPSDLLSTSEAMWLTKLSRENYPKFRHWLTNVEKVIPDNAAAKEKAAKEFWEWCKSEQPKFLQNQVAWSHFGMFGPEYFFRDSFIGKELALTDDQLESVREARQGFLAKFESQTLELEELAYDKILKKLSSAQRAKLYSKFEREYLMEILSMEGLAVSRFHRNMETEGLAPVDWSRRSRVQYPHNYFGVFPECLLKSKGSLGCCSEVSEVNQEMQRAVHFGGFYSYNGVWLFLQAEHEYQFEEAVLSKLESTTEEGQDFEARRNRYDEEYSKLLATVKDEDLPIVLGAEVVRRGLIGFLVEPSIAEWLGVDEEGIEELVKATDLAREEAVLLRKELINANAEKIFSTLSAKQREQLEGLFGLPMEDLVTIFEACSDRELRKLFGDKRPSFSVEKYVDPADSIQ